MTLRKRHVTPFVFAAFFGLSPALASSTPDQWILLSQATIEEQINGDLWRAEKTIPDSLRAAANTPFEISGIYVPIQAEPFISQFLLVESAQNCPFCGTDGSGPVVEVHLKGTTADMPEFTEVTIVGDLTFVEDPETLQLFILKNARLKN